MSSANSPKGVPGSPPGKLPRPATGTDPVCYAFDAFNTAEIFRAPRAEYKPALFPFPRLILHADFHHSSPNTEIDEA
jgi:hypothetical protein